MPFPGTVWSPGWGEHAWGEDTWADAEVVVEPNPLDIVEITLGFTRTVAAEMSLTRTVAIPLSFTRSSSFTLEV